MLPYIPLSLSTFEQESYEVITQIKNTYDFRIFFYSFMKRYANFIFYSLGDEFILQLKKYCKEMKE